MSAEIVAVDIRGIAAGGDGVGSLPEGRTVFVPRAAPGDRVTLRDVRMHRRYARASIADIVRPSDQRVEPGCPHYLRDQCGSCQLMHIDIAAQREAKQRIAGDALKRLGHLDVAAPPVQPAPSAWRYRSKITLAVASGRIGYHRIDRPNQIFDVVDCPIADERLVDLHRRLAPHRNLLPRNVTRVVYRLDRTAQLHLVVRTATGDAWAQATLLHERLAATAPVVIWWHPEGGAPRAMAGSDDPWPATVFEQVHPAMGDLVRNAAVQALGAVPGDTVWDLYAGVGDTSRMLHQRGARVISVERDPRAVLRARAMLSDDIIIRAGNVEDLLPELTPPARVITNPPRTGMHPLAVKGLLDLGPARIVYISCDQATLARDLSLLSPRYQISALELFDQFPQTAHMECMAVLDRR